VAAQGLKAIPKEGALSTLETFQVTHKPAVSALALNDPRVLQAALDWAMRQLVLTTEAVRERAPKGVIGQVLMSSQRRILGMEPLIELPLGKKPA